MPNLSTLVAIKMPSRNMQEYSSQWHFYDDRAEAVESVCKTIEARMHLLCDSDLWSLAVISAETAEYLDGWFTQTAYTYDKPSGLEITITK